MANPALINQSLYPTPSKEHLKSLFVNQPLSALPTPGAVLDLALVKRNCDRMLRTCDILGLTFRGHVKSHKTVELTRYQLLGSSLDASGHRPGRVCVSTIAEAEALIPLIKEGLVTDLLYAFPIPPSALPRLHELIRVPFPNIEVSVLVDNYAQLSSSWSYLEELTAGKGSSESAWSYGIFLKLDAGYGRAGVHFSENGALLEMIRLARDLQGSGIAKFRGIYTHAGDSYAGQTAESALWSMTTELCQGLDAIHLDTEGKDSGEEIILSVGASPTALTLGNLVGPLEEELANNSAFAYLQRLIKQAKDLGRVTLEVHAGVYTLLDLQQIATHALVGARSLGLADIAFTVIAEVASTYVRRSEALVNVGTIGIGREPGQKDAIDNGWGLLSDWTLFNEESRIAAPLGDGGWLLRKVSQEHGILAFKKGCDCRLSLEIGNKVRIFPQHACIAGSGHGWYYVVDSDQPDGGNTVHDIWVRCRGW